MKVLIVGFGEVGKGWTKVNKLKNDYLAIDIDTILNPIDYDYIKKPDVMHICIPFIEDFEKIVVEYIKRFNPKLTIINTSCQVGTTRKIYNKTKKHIVHIPVMGIHPNIDKGIKTFTNFIGGINAKSNELAKNYLHSLGINYFLFNNPEETEMAKLLDTSYYGWNILFAKQVYELCKEHKLNYTNVYKNLNETYNQGYKKLGKTNVIRPVFLPPQIFNRKINIKNNKMNGHCIRTNLNILKKLKKSKKIKFIDYAIELDEIC